MTAAAKVVIVAHPRSGSNTLLAMLRSEPGVTILNEPFNEAFETWLPANPDYLSKVTDTASLDLVVDSILSSYSGLKVHTYQLDLEFLGHLLARPDLHVVFLRRRNLLEAVVSSSIAEQTGLWAAWDRDRDIEDYYQQLEPLSVDDVRILLENTRADLDAVAAILRARPDGRALEVVYEDLFLADAATRHLQIDTLWAHLGLPPHPGERVSRFVEHAAFRMGGPSTYGRLPNLAEIESLLGSDATGHIGYAGP